MILNNKVCVVLLLFSSSLAAQQLFSTKLNGKLYSIDGDVSGVHIQNITAKRATISNADGFFSITANVNDTIVFSAVQFKKKTLVVTKELVAQSLVQIQVEDTLTELEEVVVTPYNLTGDITKDLNLISIDPVVTSSTLGLPNAYVKPMKKAERELYAATANPYMSFDPLINAISGRTKMLKKRVARNKLYAKTEQVRAFYADSLFRIDLKIPADKIDDLLYFCEVDTIFQQIVATNDPLRIWEYIRRKSKVYRKNNNLN